MQKPIRVVVADESRSVRLLLTSLLREDERFDVVAEVASAAALGDRIDEADLVVLDVVLEDCDGFTVIEDLRARTPQVAAVIVAAADPPYLRAEAARRGADAYFTHRTEPGELLDGLAAATISRASLR